VRLHVDFQEEAAVEADTQAEAGADKEAEAMVLARVEFLSLAKAPEAFHPGAASLVNNSRPISV
jgi:hypothetical protein